MKKMELEEDRIIIITQKKKLFGGISESKVEIFLKDIESVGKELFNNELNSSTIFLKNGNEQSIAIEALEQPFKLNEMLELLETKKSQYGYRLEVLKIDEL